MRIIGIDPGKTGAIVFYEYEPGGPRCGYHKLDYDDNGILNGDLVGMIKDFDPDMVVLEKVQGRSGWRDGAVNSGSATASFKLGAFYGQLLILIKLAGVPVIYVPPKKWQKPIHKCKDMPKDITPKQRTTLAYAKLHPMRPIPLGPRGGKAHDGVVDALMIATWYAIEVGCFEPVKSMVEVE